ncbi:MAG TPA: tRNA pseudouridine(55) synthase TruB [Thermoclostridium sp.]|nr:tRNA pseudouridine(55) synthase TruB [Thermoclostridium sp.]
MDGILLVIKPPDMTSFDVVSYLRGLLKIKKIGHAGTLDPAACGLLPVCIGKATKSIDWFQDFDKSYRTEMVLGLTTDTQDAEGKTINEVKVEVDDTTIVNTINTFVGEYAQIPPMYSAIRIKGQRLYDLARQGIEVERNPRDVYISKIDTLEIKKNKDITSVRFDADCSKGTYIRTLCHDIGQKLGCGAHMSFLVRTRVGDFSITDGVTLEEVKKRQEEGALSSILKSVDLLFLNYKRVVIDRDMTKKFLNGAFVSLEEHNLLEVDKTARVYFEDGTFIGLGKVFCDGDRKKIRASKLFISNNFLVY